MSLTIGIDVGGTKVAAGVVDQHGSIVEKLKRATPSGSPELTAKVIGETVTELAGRHKVDSVGIGAAGFIDVAGSGVLFAPNLAWRNEPLRQRVEDYAGLPVVVENDANAAAWAETMLGAARGHEHVMLVAVGTGIGAGIVINGQLYRGRWGIAGEPGHYRVVPEGRLCGCGNRGCWEQYASGSALVAEAREFARRSPGGAVRLLQLGGGNADGINGREVTQAASEGDCSGPALFRDRRKLARPGPRRAGCHPRPGLFRDRRRSVGSWRSADPPGAGRVRGRADRRLLPSARRDPAGAARPRRRRDRRGRPGAPLPDPQPRTG